MSSIVLSPGATGAAAFTIEAPSTATSRVITLPDATDTLVGKATTDTLTNKTLVAPALGTPASGNLANCTGAITSGTAQASTSGTSIDFTGLPSGVKRVTVMFNGVSTNGSSTIRLQLGDAGGVEATGYSNLTAQISNTWGGAGTSSSGFDGYGDGGAAFLRSGHLVFATLGSNIWTLVGAYTLANGSGFSYFFTGAKTLSDTLTQVRITTVNGTDTFDAGSINILYES